MAPASASACQACNSGSAYLRLCAAPRRALAAAIRATTGGASSSWAMSGALAQQMQLGNWSREGAQQGGSNACASARAAAHDGYCTLLWIRPAGPCCCAARQAQRRCGRCTGCAKSWSGGSRTRLRQLVVAGRRGRDVSSHASLLRHSGYATRTNTIAALAHTTDAVKLIDR